LLIEALNAPVISMANLSDLIQYLEASGSEQAETTLSNMRDYQALYWQA
jgi:orotate phosphoribosyltransferase